MAAIIYFLAAAVLFISIKIKKTFHYYPSRAVTFLFFSLNVLGMMYCLRLFMAFKGVVPLVLHKKEEYFLRIALTCLPCFCILMASVAQGKQKKSLLKKNAVLFAGLFLLAVVVNGLINKGFSFQFFLVHLVYIMSFAFCSFGIMLFWTMSKNLKFHDNTCKKEVRYFKITVGTLLFISLMAFTFVFFQIYFPAHIFFTVSFSVYMVFLIAIFGKVTKLHPVGSRLHIPLAEQNNTAWRKLEEANEKINRTHYDVYKRILHHIETAQPYKFPYYTREELAVAVGTNTTYVSRALSQHAKMNFKQFINYYRVAYAKDYFRQFPHARLIELCNVAGFRSLSALNQAFQLNEGMSPGEWCKRQRSNYETKENV
jgi:AraC-like DNA-binding protein